MVRTSPWSSSIDVEVVSTRVKVPQEFDGPNLLLVVTQPCKLVRQQVSSPWRDLFIAAIIRMPESRDPVNGSAPQVIWFTLCLPHGVAQEIG